MKKMEVAAAVNLGGRLPQRSPRHTFSTSMPARAVTGISTSPPPSSERTLRTVRRVADRAPPLSCTAHDDAPDRGHLGEPPGLPAFCGSVSELAAEVAAGDAAVTVTRMSPSLSGRPLRLGAVAAHFGRDIERAAVKVAGIVEDARRRDIDLLVLPDATLGGYLVDIRDPQLADLPPALGPDAPELAAIVALAGPMTVCFGFTELDAGVRYNAAWCVSGDGVLGRHRKVHQPAGESLAYAAGDAFAAFDSPVGRMGMLIDYDKTFPESARTLARDGAEIISCLSAWPASVTDRAARIPQDRQSRLFDLYDCARAAENQVVVVSANQTGVLGGLRFLGQAKVVGPGGDVLARTWTKGGIAVADLDVHAEVTRARRVLHHLAERRPDTYLAESR